MSKRSLLRALLGAGTLLAAATGAHAATFVPNDPTLPDIRITEFMYKNEGSPAELLVPITAALPGTAATPSVFGPVVP